MDQYPPPPIEPRPHPLARDGHEPVVLKPLEVAVAEGKIEKALRKLKKKMAAEGVLKELKRRRRATKPSDQKRRKRMDAARRRRKRERAAAKRK
jgi:small subunit ribosomal protein S21